MATDNFTSNHLPIDEISFYPETFEGDSRLCLFVLLGHELVVFDEP